MDLTDKIAAYEHKIEVLESELNAYQKRCKQYAQAYDQMQHQLKELIRHRFGQKSERFIDDDNLQHPLFDAPAAPIEHYPLAETIWALRYFGRSRSAPKSPKIPLALQEASLDQLVFAT